MWYPVKIILRRFQSHTHTEYCFEENKAVLVVGRNLDENSGQESNGSGKSALLEGLTFCLLGVSLRGVRNSELIQNEIGEASVEFTMRNDMIEETVIIERCISDSKPEKVAIFVNDKPARNLAQGIGEANKYILQLLEISKEDLLDFYLIHAENYTSFLTASDSAKKALINRFSRANVIDGVFPAITAQVNTTLAAIRMQEQKQAGLEAKLETLSVMLGDTDFDRILEIRSMQRHEIGMEIEQAEEDVETHKQHQQLKEDEAHKITVLLRDRTPIDYSTEKAKINAQIAENRAEKKEMLRDEKEANKLLSETNHALGGLIECPNCEHEFNPADKEGLSKEDLEENLQEIKLALQEMEDERVRNATASDNLQRKLIKLQDQEALGNRELNRLEQEHANYQAEAAMAMRRAESARAVVRQITQRLASFDANPPVDPSAKLKQQIVEAETALAETITALHQLNVEYGQHGQWTEHFKSFKSQLANTAISTLNGYINLNLQKINSDLQVELSGYRELASKKGQLKEEITATVLRNGVSQGSFKKFSSGERARIDICTILTVQQLINNNAKCGGLNLLVLDEVLDSVDSKGLYSILHAVNLLERSILVVTLGNFTSEYQHKVIVQKQNEESRILS